MSEQTCGMPETMCYARDAEQRRIGMMRALAQFRDYVRSERDGTITEAGYAAYGGLIDELERRIADIAKAE